VFLADEVGYSIAKLENINLEDVISTKFDLPSPILKESPFGMMKQMTNVASALTFLHTYTATRLDLQRWCVSHNDIKPYNILGYWRGNLDLCDIEYDFVLKLTGFQFATRHKESAPGSRVTDVGEPMVDAEWLASHRAIGEHFLYVAPEVSGTGQFNGHKADIWSFGQILEALIWFAAGGFLSKSHLRVGKVSVANQIAATHDEDPTPWTESYEELIGRMCSDDPKDRPDAPYVHTMLQAALQHKSRRFQQEFGPFFVSESTRHRLDALARLTALENLQQ
jgi:serine/threonine protein kinase